MLTDQMTDEEKALALEQAMAMSSTSPSKEHAERSSKIDSIMGLINTLNSQGVSHDKLLPYVQQLQEEKAKLMNEKSLLPSMDEQQSGRNKIGGYL
jgi:hypothetical protein